MSTTAIGRRGTVTRKITMVRGGVVMRLVVPCEERRGFYLVSLFQHPTLLNGQAVERAIVFSASVFSIGHGLDCIGLATAPSVLVISTEESDG